MNPASSSARTRRRHGGAEIPARSAKSTLVMRPFAWRSRRIRRSILSSFIRRILFASEDGGGAATRRHGPRRRRNAASVWAWYYKVILLQGRAAALGRRWKWNDRAKPERMGGP